MLEKFKKKHIYPISDHYDGKTFFNPNLKIKKSLKQALQMMHDKKMKEKWPVFVKNTATAILANDLTFKQCYITYINHASHLIQLKNLNILTDPLYARKAGPLSLIGPKRVRDPGVLLKDLPPIHVVLVSHNHYDHMDLSALKKLERKFHPVFIVPLGNRQYLERKQISNIIELDWWQSHVLNDTQTITLMPAQHWSMRGMNDANVALWGGFWIQSSSMKIYFAGDTGYGSLFKEIHQRLGAPDISILPIGSYEPRWFMKPQHLNPEEAVLASLDLKSRLSIATHHQTFRLSHEGFYEPKEALEKAMKLHGIKKEAFLIPENGETIVYNIGPVFHG